MLVFVELMDFPGRWVTFMGARKTGGLSMLKF